jgi:hypothetical protein
MLVRALNSARALRLGIVLVAFAAATLQPGLVEAQTTTAKPPTAVKPAQPPAKPASPPTAKPSTPGAAKPAAKPDASQPAAQAPAAGKVTMASLAGTWDGIAQTPNGDMPVHMVLTHQDGKITGSIESQMGMLTITGSALTGDILELGFDLQGSSGGLSGKVDGDKYEGSWSVGAESGPFAAARIPPPGAKPAAPAAAAAVADPISGEWNGEANVGGQAMPFTLTLKLSGETVSGEIESATGKVPLISGAWKDKTLLLAFPYSAGEPVSMGGQIVDGKLIGVLDYNKGEMQGTWTAVKKKE